MRLPIAKVYIRPAPLARPYRVDRSLRSWVTAGLLLLLAAPFSGCLGGSDPSEDGLGEGAGVGSVVGTVFNEAALPLAGARVTLVRTTFQDATGRDGRFELVNVTAGVYILRIEASGFQAFENRTVVAPGNVTEVAAYLIPKADTGAGYRPHSHDLWQGRGEVTIMDREQDFNNPERSSGIGGPHYYKVTSMVVHPNRNSSDADMLIPIPSDGVDPGIIFPGTKEIRVSASWDSSDGVLSKVLLKYTPATGGEKRVLSRLPSGGTWRIQVGPLEADTGHQRFTLWNFWLNPSQEPLGDGTDYRPGLLMGPIRIKIVIVRGDLYTEPAHEDHWAGQSELPLVDHDRLRDCNSAYRIWERVQNPCLLESGIKPVPPGTQRLRVEMKWTYYQADGVQPSDLVIVWRTAAMNRHTTSGPELVSGGTKATGPQTRTVEIEVKPGETDAFYQKYSLWAFGFAVKGHEKDEVDHEPRNLRMTFKVVAVRDPSFEGGSA